MAQTLNWEPMSPELTQVAKRAKQEPLARFHSLAHLIDVAALERAYHRMRADAATGVDGITKETYGLRLEENRNRSQLLSPPYGGISDFPTKVGML